MKNPIFRRPPILFATGAVVGAAALATLQFASTFVGESKENNDTEALVSGNSVADSDSSAQAQSMQVQRDEADLRNEIRNLRDIERFTSPFEQSLALHQLVSIADEATLIELADQSLEIESDSRRRLVQETIFQKFASIHPEQALVEVEKLKRFDRELVLSTIFKEYALVDLDVAVANTKLQSGSRKTAAVRGILQARDDLSQDVLREIARSVGNEQLALDMIARSNVEKAITNPKMAWQSLLDDETRDRDQISLFASVAEAWLEEDGLGALQELHDSFTDYRTQTQVLGPILSQLVESDARGAFDFAESIDDSDSSLLRIIATRWASLDPAAAYDAVSTVGPITLRNSLQESVAYRWATDRPREVLSDLDRFTTASRDRAQNSAIVSISKESPEEAAELFAAIEGGTNRQGIAIAIATVWSQENPLRALEWILSNPQLGNTQQRMLTIVLKEIAIENPQLAMETALDQPLEEHGVGQELNVIKSISNYDLSKARSMLSQTREGRTRYATVDYLGVMSVNKGETDLAMELANELNERSRPHYKRKMLRAWANSSPLDLYESLAQLESSEFQSHAAFWLINNNQWRKVLSEDQIKSAEKFLSDQEYAALEQSRNTERFHQRWTPEGIVVESEVRGPAPIITH